MSILREIITRLTVQTDPAKIARFQGALSQAREESKKLTSALGGVAAQLAGIAAGVAGGLGFRAITTELAEQTHVLNNHAAAVGMTVEEYSRLQAASAQFVEETGKDMRDFLADLADYGRDALANPTGGYAMDLKALGVELVDANGKLKSQFDLLLAVSDRMHDVPLTAERMGIMSAVFSTGALEMSEFLQLGREGILAQMAAVDQAAIVTKQHVKVSKDFRAAMMGVKTIVQGVRMEMGMKLMPILAKSAKDFTNWWRTGDNGVRLLQRIQGGLKLISTILAVIMAFKLAVYLRIAVGLTIAWGRALWAAAAALGAVKIALIAIPVLLATMALLIEDIIVWAEGGNSAIGAFIDKFAESDSVLGRLARWLRDHKDQLVSGAQAIASGFFKFLEMVKTAGPAVLATIKRAWGAVVGFFNGGAQGIIASLGSGLAAAMGALWGWIKAPFVALGQRISAWVGGLIDDLMGVEVVSQIVAALGSLYGSVKSVLGSIWDVAESLATGIYEAFGPLLPAVISLFKALGALGAALVKLVFAAVQIVWALWTLKGKVIWAVVKAMAPHVWALTKRIAEVIAAAIGKIAGWIADIVSWIAEKVTWAVENVVKPALAWITEAIGWLADKAVWVGEKAGIAIGWVAEGVVWLAEKVAWLAEQVAWLVGKVIEGVAWIAEKAAWVVGQIVSGVTWLVTTIAEGVALVAQGLAYVLDNYVTPAINWLTTGVDWLTGIFKDIAEGIKGAFKSAFDAVMTFAQPIIGIIDGLKGTVDWAADKLGLSDGAAGGAASNADLGALARNKFTAAGISNTLGADAAARLAGGNNTNVGQVNVIVQGTTNMGPTDLANATQRGVEQGLTKDAARDLSVGGGG